MKIKKLILIAGIVSTVIIFGSFSFRFCYYKLKKILIASTKIKPFIPAKCDDCNTFFYDGISTHEKAYRKEGISPQKTFEDLEKLKKQGILVELEDNDLYFISNLNHSRPFLLKDARLFLNELGARYKENCDKNGIHYKRFKVTSLTRCITSVNDLRKVNSVAIENSAHLKGKTFDISYAHFGDNTAQLTQFINALKEARNEGKCFVKYEKNTGCLHITAI